MAAVGQLLVCMCVYKAIYASMPSFSVASLAQILEQALTRGAKRVVEKAKHARLSGVFALIALVIAIGLEIATPRVVANPPSRSAPFTYRDH